MFELTPDNAGQYLRDRGWIGPGRVMVRPLGGGVSNCVLRVESDRGLFVLKQSRPQLRTRDAWFSDMDRVYREQEVMQFLGPLLPAGVVPAVLRVDRPNYVFAMTHAPEESRVWKERLLAGDVDQDLGQYAGRVLGMLHQTTSENSAALSAFRDHTVFVQLRVEPFYRRIQERIPELAERVEPIVERMLTLKEAMCHGDYSPKNILSHSTGFTLVDYETAHFGDPTMDLGFFLSHLMLKAVRRHAEREGFFELTRRFWQGYAAEVRWRPSGVLVRRGIEHLAVCMLARIDGTSPVDYLPEEPLRQAARGIGRAVLREAPTGWDEVIAIAERHLRQIWGD